MTLSDPNDNNQIESQHTRADFNFGSVVLFIGVLCVIGIIGWKLLQRDHWQPTSGRAPDFTVTTFDGSEITLSEMQGKIVVVNFWGSWCGPCRAEAQELQRVYDRFKNDDVLVLGITYLDTSSDSMAFIKSVGLTYPNAPDPDTTIAEDKYHIQGAPESFVINRQGQIAHTEFGPTSEARLVQIIEELLATDQAA